MKKAFTLIELMVTITVIGIITAIVLPSFTQHSNDAKVANVQSNLANLRTSIQMFHASTDEFPDLAPHKDNLENIQLTSESKTSAFTDFYSKNIIPVTPL